MLRKCTDHSASDKYFFVVCCGKRDGYLMDKVWFMTLPMVEHYSLLLLLESFSIFIFYIVLLFLVGF